AGAVEMRRIPTRTGRGRHARLGRRHGDDPPVERGRGHPCRVRGADHYMVWSDVEGASVEAVRGRHGLPLPAVDPGGEMGRPVGRIEGRRGRAGGVSKCGGSTWKYSSVEAVLCSGVPLTNSVVGAWPANPRTDAVV